MSVFHLIAPSGYCVNQQAARRGVARLEQAGHQVNNQAVISRCYQRFAGTQAERLNDINHLAALPAANTIVMPVRGGYGASRLLEDIDWSALVARQQHNPLLICGHSDFTAIQLGLLAKGNVITFSGPMLAGNFGAETRSPFTERHFWQALSNSHYSVEWQGNGPDCHVAGTLWGGNLSMLVSLIGTPWMPVIENGILVLEDVNEAPFRLERMLLQLDYAGILSRQCAVVTGSFSALPAGRDDDGYNLATMYDYLRSRLSVPLITGLMFGHEAQTVTLPLGAQAMLIHSANISRLILTGHPWLN